MPKPLATYRLQLHSEFGFDSAAAIADYLEALGVSHVYCSPYLQAMPGSRHGYDVADHHRVNMELGGEEGHHRFCMRLGACHLGQVLDIVPNHMAIGGRWNAWWWDVLENGLASPYASYFDIDWQSPEERLRNKILLPILGDHYGRVLKKKEFRLVREGAEFTLRYYEHVLPIAPESVAPILAAASTKAAGNEDDTVGAEALGFLADSLLRLPASEKADRATLVGRSRDKEVIRRWLARLFSERAPIAQAVDAQTECVNSDEDALHAVLERQNYRLAHWKTASSDLGYRRFFDINTLIGLHMEDEQVFSDTHSLLFRWLRAGVIDGLRVDHPDGLRDPREYFERLRQAAPHAWVVAEKILERGEELPKDWPIEGTTGYDFLNMAAGLYIDPAAEEPLTRFYNEFTGRWRTYDEVAHEKKGMVLRDLLGSDVGRLTAMFREICELNRDHRDYTDHEIRHALRALVAEYPVYRTYVRAASGEVTGTDTACVNQAVEAAKKCRSDLDAELFDFMGSVLLLKQRGEAESNFVMQFQQFTGPAMAKGVEDTAFYTYNRLIASNEVGSDPAHFAVSPDEFHAYCERRQKHWPLTQLASSTHDTKRSEDVRARLAVLSEIPAEWRASVERWAAQNEQYKREGLPDRNTEYMLYQTMVGAWPIDEERAHAYMLKASRESKEQTKWTEPNAAFEEALAAFIKGIYADSEFISNFETFTKILVPAGRVNSLAQTLLRMTAPGIPDIYQGTEIWDLSLVDPDNRRPVDYEMRRSLLAEMNGLTIAQIVSRADDGLPKLWTITQSLKTRRKYPQCFGEAGTYLPLRSHGKLADRIVTYRRGEDVIAVVPRCSFAVTSWEDTSVEIPAGKWKNALTSRSLDGGALKMDNLFHQFPVALLTRAD